MIRIIVPTTDSELEDVRRIMRAFVSWHIDRHSDDIELINSYFAPNEFEQELRNLPGIYSQPEGCLLLAYYAKTAAGSVALKQIEASACEMKRMFVYPEFHGKGIGRALGQEIIRKAREAGYARMYLDTSIRQVEAKTLYRSLGFSETAPYYPVTEALEKWLVFMHLELASER